MRAENDSRIKSLAHPAKKFKVEMNAKQLHMTGLILLHNNINLVIVEGGKFTINLILCSACAVSVLIALTTIGGGYLLLFYFRTKTTKNIQEFDVKSDQMGR